MADARSLRRRLDAVEQELQRRRPNTWRTESVEELADGTERLISAHGPADATHVMRLIWPREAPGQPQ